MWGMGSSVRKAMLNSASPDRLAPPGAGAGAPGPGLREPSAAVSHRPTPADIRTTDVPGFHAVCGMSTSIWLRALSTDALGAGPTGRPVVASSRSALAPWTVRKSWAGDDTPAPCGQARRPPESPSATVKATLSGALIVL